MNTNFSNQNENSKLIEEEQHQLITFTSPYFSNPISVASTKEVERNTLLPPDFVLTDHSVVCGRGRYALNAVGNRRLRVVVCMFQKRYSEATSRAAKSVIVSEIISMIREASPTGAFVKHENGRWWEVHESVARDKVGSMLRGCSKQQRNSNHSQLSLCRKQEEQAKQNP